MPECSRCGLFLVSPIARRTHERDCTVIKEPDPPIKKWLASKGLEHLTSRFLDKEYTDVAVITEMGLDEEDLDYLGITDTQHRAVLKAGRTAGVAPVVAPSAVPDDVDLMRQRVADLEERLRAKEESDSLASRMAALEEQLSAKARGDELINRLEEQLSARERAADQQTAEIARLEELAMVRRSQQIEPVSQHSEPVSQQQSSESEPGKISKLEDLSDAQRTQLVKELAKNVPDPDPENGVRYYDLPEPGDPGTFINSDGQMVWRETDEMKAQADQKHKEMVAHAALMKVEREQRKTRKDRERQDQQQAKIALTGAQTKLMNAQVDQLELDLAAVKTKLHQVGGASRTELRERGMLRNKQAGLEEQRIDLLKQLVDYDSDDEASVERLHNSLKSRSEKSNQNAQPKAIQAPVAAEKTSEGAAAEERPEAAAVRKVWRGADAADGADTEQAGTDVRKLPAGWERRADPESGQEYFVDHSTKCTQWDHPLAETDTVDAPADPAQRDKQTEIFVKALQKAQDLKDNGRQMFQSSTKLERYQKGSEVMDRAFVRKVQGAIQCWEEGLFALDDFNNDWDEERRKVADEVRAACGGNLVLAYMKYHQTAQTSSSAGSGPKTEHLEAALSCIDEVLQYTPKHSKSLYRRAQVHQAMKSYREAEADLTLAKSISPNSTEIRNKLKEVKRQVKDRLQAQACHEETKRMEIRRRKEEMKGAQRAKDVHNQCINDENVRDYEHCMLLHDNKYLMDVDGTITDWEVPKSNGGRGSDYYFWGQTLSGVTAYARVGLDEMGGNVKIVIKTNELSVTVKQKTGEYREVLAGKLHEAVRPEESFWEMERPGIVYIYLKKLYPTLVNTEQTMREAREAGLDEPVQPERNWWNKLVHGGMTAGTDRMRANANDLDPEDARRSARRVQKVIAEGKTIDQDYREQAVVGDRKTAEIEAESKKKKDKKEEERIANMTDEERKHKYEQDEMYRTMGQHNGPKSNPRDRVIWDSSDEEDSLETMHSHVQDGEKRHHLNTIQKNFSARMRKNKRSEDVIDAELRVEEIEMERRLAAEKKSHSWMI